MFWSATLGAKTGGKLTADVEQQIFMSFPPVSLVWVPPTRRLSQYPCPKFDLAALLYNIYNAYILKQRLIRATSEMHFSLPKWVQITHRAPHSPPECRNSRKCQWFRYNIKYLAFRWGKGGVELGEQLIGTVLGWLWRGDDQVVHPRGQV